MGGEGKRKRGETWTRTVEKRTKRTGHNKFVPWGYTLSGVGAEGIEDTTYLTNIIDKILLALKFKLSQKYSASKS